MIQLRRKFVTRNDFVSHLQIQRNLRKSTINDLSSITDRSFRHYAKWMFMEARTEEEQDLHNKIKKEKINLKD